MQPAGVLKVDTFNTKIAEVLVNTKPVDEAQNEQENKEKITKDEARNGAPQTK